MLKGKTKYNDDRMSSEPAHATDTDIGWQLAAGGGNYFSRKICVSW